jgi:hypothetical protein
MVEIRYGDQFEISDLAGQTVGEARGQFKSEFGIPDKATARLNGSKVKTKAEIDTVLNDDDKLTFAVSRSKTPFLIGALLLVLAITGGVFTYGFINASTSLDSYAATQDFAAVTANDSANVTLWRPFGYYKGSIVSTNFTKGGIFVIDTQTSGYEGDLAVTVSLANADTLAKCYRMLAIQLCMYDSKGNLLDINESGGASLTEDYVLLTLDNGSVTMFPKGIAGGDIMTVRVKSGFYITHVWKAGNWSDPNAYMPLLFCEVAQR